MASARVQVYIDDGRVFEYEVGGNNTILLQSKIREHHHQIVTNGYRSVSPSGVMESFPVHRILKVKTTHDCLTTLYPDTVRGT